MDFLILTATLLYGLSVPLGYFWGDTKFKDIEIIYTLKAFCLFALFFTIGFLWIAKKMKIENFNIRHTPRLLFNNLTIVAFSIIIFIFFIIYFQKLGGISNIYKVDRGELFKNKASVGVWSLSIIYLKFLVIIFLIKRDYLPIKKGVLNIYTWGIVVLSIFFIVFNLSMGDRRMVAYFVLSIIAFFSLLNKISNRKIIIYSTILMFLFLSFAKFRHLIHNPAEAVQYVKEKSSMKWIDPGQSELSISYFIFTKIHNEIDKNNLKIENGAEYLQSTTILLPRFFFESGIRPYEGFSEWFVKTFYKKYAKTGGGYASSFIGEIYLNFGWYGLIIIPLLLGISLALAWNYLIVKNYSDGSVLIYISLLPTFFVIHRMDLIALIKEMFLFTFLPIAFIFIFRTVLKGRFKESKSNSIN